MPYGRKNWVATLEVEGRDLGKWAQKEGGGTSVEPSSYPDWDGDVVLSGKKSRKSATLKKLYREDVHEVYEWLDERSGSADIVLTMTPIDDDGVPWGKPTVLTGKLGDVDPPDMDKGSSEGGEITVVLNLNTKLA